MQYGLITRIVEIYGIFILLILECRKPQSHTQPESDPALHTHTHTHTHDRSLQKQMLPPARPTTVSSMPAMVHTIHHGTRSAVRHQPRPASARYTPIALPCTFLKLLCIAPVRTHHRHQPAPSSEPATAASVLQRLLYLHPGVVCGCLHAPLRGHGHGRVRACVY